MTEVEYEIVPAIFVFSLICQLLLLEQLYLLSAVYSILKEDGNPQRLASPDILGNFPEGQYNVV